MQVQKLTAKALLVFSAIFLLAVLSWHPRKPQVRKHLPVITAPAVTARAVRTPPAPTAPEHPKAPVHPRTAATQPKSDAHTRVIVVSLADRRLALIEDGAVKKVYTVAIGKASTPSPTGSFTIAQKVADPTYYHEGKVIPPGPNNPVGTRWMGLSTPGYGIHGTNAPRSIGKAASHGCIRMRQADLEDLFAQVRTGDTVEILGERDAQTIALFGGAPVPVTPATSAPMTAAQAVLPSEPTVAQPDSTAPSAATAVALAK